MRDHTKLQDFEGNELKVFQVTFGIQSLISSITPTKYPRSELFPCQVTLNSNIVENRVYLIKPDDYLEQFATWPDPNDIISLDEVKSIRESPERLPLRFVNKINETGMGYSRFWLVSQDKQKFFYQAGNLLDFLQMQGGYHVSDVADIEMEENTIRRDTILTNASYKWCFFNSKL